jgi:hypothetical protein
MVAEVLKYATRNGRVARALVCASDSQGCATTAANDK